MKPRPFHAIPKSQNLVGDCASLASLFTSRSVQITHWCCRVDGLPLRSERFFDWHVLTLPCSGASVLHRRGKAEIVDPTRAVLHAPGEPYRTSHPFGCGDWGWSLALRGDLLQAVADSHGLHLTPVIGTVSLAGSSAARSLRRLLHLHRLQSGLEVEAAMIEESAFDLLDVVAQRLVARPAGDIAAIRPATRRQHRRTVEAARSVLCRRFREPLQLDDVAREAHVSAYHLSRLFKSATGLPVHRYLSRLRVMAALVPLAEGCRDLTELALDLGFSSHSHFTSVFRQDLGLPPSEFRRLASRATLGEARKALARSL